MGEWAVEESEVNTDTYKYGKKYAVAVNTIGTEHNDHLD